MADQKQVFFHVGLGKTGSTYLQKKVFPKLKGIRYISTHHYKQSKKILESTNDEKVLVSREFDRQFEEEVRWFTKDYPEARIIIVFRRHDQWIASQYKRHVKNGFFYSFQDFFDIKNDNGFWKKKELDYSSKLRIIQECCVHPPLVLDYDELMTDPFSYVQKITDYMGVAPLEKVPVEKVHQSYSEKQLLVLRSFCRKYIRVVPKNHKNKLKHWCFYRPFWILFHLVLYAAKLLPASWVSKQPLINPGSLEAIEHHAVSDWERVKQNTH